MECDCSSLFVNIFTRTIDCVDCGAWKALAWFFLDVHVALYRCHPFMGKGFPVNRHLLDAFGQNLDSF